MANTLATYYKRIGISGGDLRASNIQSSRTYLEKTIKDDPSYYEVAIGETLLDCRIYDKNSKTNGRANKHIMSPIHQSFCIGDIMYVERMNKYFLCTYQENYHDIYNTGLIEECNYNLRWKDSFGQIKEMKCVVEDTSKNSVGIDETKVINYGAVRICVLLPFCDDVCMIKKDQRFLIDYNHYDPKAYKVTSVNTIDSYSNGHGVVRIIMEECARNINDNIDEMIADYYNNIGTSSDTETSEPDVIVEPKAAISYAKSFIKIGSTAKIGVEFANVEDVTEPKWSIVSDFDVKIVSMIDNYIEIKIDFNVDYIGSVIKVIVTDKNELCRDEINLEIRGVV